MQKIYCLAAGDYRLAPKWLQTKGEGREEGGCEGKPKTCPFTVRVHRLRSAFEEKVHGLDPPPRPPLREGVTNGAGHNYILFSVGFL